MNIQDVYQDKLPVFQKEKKKKKIIKKKKKFKTTIFLRKVADRCLVLIQILSLHLLSPLRFIWVPLFLMVLFIFGKHQRKSSQTQIQTPGVNGP